MMDAGDADLPNETATQFLRVAVSTLALNRYIIP